MLVVGAPAALFAARFHSRTSRRPYTRPILTCTGWTTTGTTIVMRIAIGIGITIGGITTTDVG